ncbi:LCP family protein [Cellulosilyticum ruminicola]|uniref:LCP family protein n=1 Tax=Cellulosilyticum ruminicola TaxID=425254 RepID=UPI0006CFADC8|nr:LCP family protein [Cellulosilyticum ruminicola]
MVQNNKGFREKKEKTLLSLFLKSVGITLLSGAILVGGFAGVYYGFLYDGQSVASVSDEVSINEEKKEESKEEKRKEINKNVVVFGVDEDGTRTDIMFVVNLNSETKKIKVLSIPRDTKVNWSESQKERLLDLKGYTRSVSKLNEMSAYGGVDNVRDFTINEIENILGIKIDNYVLVGLQSFRDIVDAVGGIEIDVPEFRGSGLHYDDYEQDLHIHLDPGMQLLDGSQAEGLIRFRKDNYGNSYTNGDTDRIKVQQQFLGAFADKILAPTVIPKLYSIISAVFSNVSTDIKLTEIPQYLSYISDFSTENITFDTVGGEGRMENGVSYFFIDYDTLDEKIQEVFHDTAVAGSIGTDDWVNDGASSENVVDRTVIVEVYNASGKNGLAGGMKDKLEKLGYTVPKIDNYKKEVFAGTVVYAKDENKAKQFLEYLPKGTVITQKIDIDSDIQIILGLDSVQ